MKSIQPFRILLLATLLIMLAAPRIFAAPRTWAGNTDGSFNNAANWGGTAPLTGDTLTFGAAGTAGSSLTADQTAGIVYNTMTFNGAGAFTIAGANGFVLGTSTAATSLTVSGGGAQIINSPFSLGNNVQTFSLSGANLTLGGTITAAGTASALTLGGTKSLTLNGSTTLGSASGNILVGTTAATDRSVLNIANNATIFDLQIGGNATAGACGAVYQTAGTVTLTDATTGSGATSPDRIFTVGGYGVGGSGGNPGYGYFNENGGSITAKQIDVGSRNTGAVGVMDVMSGSVTANGPLTIIRGNAAGTASYGVLNISGGTVTWGATIAGTIQSGVQSGNVGQVTVGGGAGSALLTAGAAAGSGGVDLGNGAAGTATTNTLNLLPNGTVTTPQVTAGNATPNSQLNFNGGTLKASATSSTFVSANLSSVTVYSAGGVIDNNAKSITLVKALSAPTAGSVGVTGVSGLSGGLGYIGAPVVLFTGGTANNGKVANAVALMTSGAVSSIRITSPGDYSVAPTGVSFIGGGAGTPATVSGVTTSANASGGMTFQGPGVTTLSGANTYSGDTTVSAGTLLVNGTTGSGAVVVSGSGSVLGGSGTISGATIISNNAALRPRPNGGSGTTLTFGNNLTLTNASAIFTLSSSASGSNDKVTGIAQLTLDSTVTFYITNSGLDQAADYTLISCTSTNPGAGGTPTLYVNGVLSDQTSAGNCQLLVTPSGVALHYIPAVLPTFNSGTFNLNPQCRSESSTLTVLVTPILGQTISSISVITDNIGGAGDPASLTRTDANGPGLQETWVGTFGVSSSKPPGTWTVAGTITQSDSATAPYSASLTVVTNVTLLTSDSLGTSSFTNSVNWSIAEMPTNGNAYLTGANTLRSPIVSGTYTFTGDSLSIDAGGRMLGKFTSSGTISANFIMNGGYMDEANLIGDGAVMTVAGTVTASASSALGAAGGETLDVVAPISGSGALQVSGAGLNGGTDSGLVKLSMANPYNGTISVTNANGGSVGSSVNRLLQLNHLNALQNATLNLVAAVANPVTFASGVNTGSFNVGALSGSASEVLSDTGGGAVALSVGGNNASTSYGGALSGSGSLTKVGSGTLTLAGASTYTGNTIISAGTLALTGPGSISSSSNIIVAGGMVFDVSGLSSTCTLVSGQTLSNSAAGAIVGGSLNTASGNVSLLYAGSPSFDQTNGTLTLSGSTVVTVNNTGSALTNVNCKLIAALTGGSVAGSLPAVTVTGGGLAPGQQASLFLSGNELYLNVTNHAPVAGNVTFTRHSGIYGFHITISDLLTNVTDADGDALSLVSTSVSTNGVTIFTSGTNYLGYSNTNNVNDSFTYTVADQYGHTGTGTITVTVDTTAVFGTQTPQLTADMSGNVNATFYGISGYTYIVQRSLDLISWTDISTNVANPTISITDNPGSPSAYYRLTWQP